MKIKIAYILMLTAGVLLLIYGCTPSSPLPIEAQATSIITSGIPTTDEIKIPTLNGISVRETERVATVFAIQTASTTPLPTPSETNTPTPESTSTPKPFSKNDILISYTRYAGDGADEITSCLNAYFSYRFVLYRNGLLIIFDKTRYLETRINQTEIEMLLSEIDKTGISSVIIDGDQYIENAPTPSSINGWGSLIKVREKSIGITDAQSNYLIEPVTKTLEIITNYRPQNLKPYMPEDVTLWVFPGRDSLLESFNPTPEPFILTWSPNIIDLKSYTNSPQDISGDTSSFLLQQVKAVPAFRRVEQNGQSYFVLICPNFPQ